MEYIHKAKAEKNRTKILSDQMEARRAKNKVRLLNFVSSLLVYPIFRAPVSVVLPAWLRSARASSQLNKRRLKSKDDVARFSSTLPFLSNPTQFFIFQNRRVFGQVCFQISSLALFVNTHMDFK